MRKFALEAALVALLVGCGHHSGGNEIDASGNPPPPDACTDDLACFIQDCGSKGLPPTTLTGTVYAPNGTLALYGVDVYVPRSTPPPLTDGVQCVPCMDQLPGGAVAATRTDEAGHFVLENVPATSNVPLVIQVGKWRRQITIPNVAACQPLQLTTADTSLPKNKAEGDIPQIAISTGGADAMECLVYKLGIDPAEFTPPSEAGRVHMFSNMALTPPDVPPDGGRGTDQFSSTYPTSDAGKMFGDSKDLWDTEAHLSKYDIVMLSCEGGQNKSTKPLTALQAMQKYADKGGRVFMSHWHNIWVGGTSGTTGHYGIPEWEALATWDFNAPQDDNPVTATVDQTVPKGPSLAKWLQNVGASPTTFGKLTVNEPRYTCSANDAAKSEQWIYVDAADSSPTGHHSVQDLMFTTPQSETDTSKRCGKVVFSDMHVSSGSKSCGGTSCTNVNYAFPLGCSNTPLSPQEKALAFIFFDIASCVGPIF